MPQKHPGRNTPWQSSSGRGLAAIWANPDEAGAAHAAPDGEDHQGAGDQGYTAASGGGAVVPSTAEKEVVVKLSRRVVDPDDVRLFGKIDRGGDQRGRSTRWRAEAREAMSQSLTGSGLGGTLGRGFPLLMDYYMARSQN